MRHPIRFSIAFGRSRFLRYSSPESFPMSTCRGGLNLRAFRLKYISSQSLSRNRSISTTAWSRPLVTPRVACRCSNLALLPRRQQRVFSSTSRFDSESTGLIENVLPICCPGCGAYSQTVNPLEPGYYSKTRKETRKRLAATNRILEKKEQESESEEGEAVDLRTEGENAARDIRQLTNPSEDGDNGPPKPPSTYRNPLSSTRLKLIYLKAGFRLKMRQLLPPTTSQDQLLPFKSATDAIPSSTITKRRLRHHHQ